MSTTQQVTDILNRSGINFERLSSPTSISFRAADFERNKGFRVEVAETTSRYLINFSLESMAADLARLIRKNVTDSHAQLELIGQLSRSSTSSQLFRVNEEPYLTIGDALEVTNWFSVSMEDVISKPLSEEALRKRVEELLTTILLLIPAEDIETVDEDLTSFDVEGAVKRGTFNSFERSAKNRRICITIFGYECKVCGVDLEKRYGAIAAEFIHVHHITPVSQMGGPREVNPLTELIPVCPNCHYVMHRTNPPTHPDKLKNNLNNA